MLSRRLSNRDERPTHTAPSGMGGVFDVAVIGPSDLAGHEQVRVVMPANPDWNGHEFAARSQDLRPLPQRVRA